MNNSSKQSTLISESALRAWLFLLRQDAKFTNFNLKWLGTRNLEQRASIVSSDGPVVSLTTHGQRIQSVYAAIESIAAGTLLPSRLILWLDDESLLAQRPASLRRLESRGLEILLSQNYGPHTKYYPYLLSQQELASPLVTADDDVMYPKRWLEGLARAYKAHPDVVNCYRAHLISIKNGAIAPYADWRGCRSTAPSLRHFATGVSGLIYPPVFLRALKSAGDLFRILCPTADDIWLHLNTLRIGMKVRQIGAHPLNFPFIPGTQTGGLINVNVDKHQNDRQIALAYGENDLECLGSESYDTVAGLPQSRSVNAI